MDPNVFNRMADQLDSKIDLIDDFVQRAHREGISREEATAMQSHVRREFSMKQRGAFRQQIHGLYRSGHITKEQKGRMEGLLDRASKIADEHFVKLSKISPEAGGGLHMSSMWLAVRGALGLRRREEAYPAPVIVPVPVMVPAPRPVMIPKDDKRRKHWGHMNKSLKERLKSEKEKRSKYGGGFAI
jgi:hypothetical protein